MTCYCDETIYRKCVPCQEKEDRNEEKRICASWNWNSTPRECATEARRLGWSVARTKKAMANFGFKKTNIDQVAYELEIGE